MAIRLIQLLLATILLSLVMTPHAGAHDDVEPIWTKTPHELIELQASIQRHRESLILALQDAMTAGVPVSALNRPYSLYSNREVLNVPRSVLNRVIVSSLQLELASAELYLFCETGCEHSLKQDLANHPESAKAVGITRRLWPKTRRAFEFLWYDIPIQAWYRTLQARTYVAVYAKSHARSLAANLRYQVNAYGPVSMMAGAAGFATAFGISEIAESMFMGPVHIVCKANYFWSVAFGTAIASLSRDLRTFLLFEKNGKSIFKRLRGAFGSMRVLRSDRKLETRILFRTITGESGVEAFGKMTKREAYSSILEPLLDAPTAQQAVATDPLLWSEIATGLDRSVQPAVGAEDSSDVEKRRLFETELELITNPRLADSRIALARWMDLHASLRSILKIASNSVLVEHQIYPDRASSLRLMGRLDLMLRTTDLFMISWIGKRTTEAEAAKDSATWLQDMLSEWLSLTLESSRPRTDAPAIEARIRDFEITLKNSIREGKPGASQASTPWKQDPYSNRTHLVNEVDREAAFIRPGRCEALFEPLTKRSHPF